MTTEGSEPKAIGADDRDLPPGYQVGEYVIESKLGQGGFGTVFKAAHPLIGKVVAIKVLNRQYSAQPEMVSRFVAEARAVNQIRNRFIIDIFGFGHLDDGRHYYVMEYLDGQPLGDYLEANGRLSLADAIPILRSIGRALDAAHAKGIAHRDLKPENIFLATESDGTLYPKLLDFGIAKLLVADDQTKHKTRTGAPIGTPYYMSPEQCRGRDVDHRTDVYAFGCVTYKLLTGVVPFDGDDYMSILMKQIGEPVPPASALAPELPASIDEVIAWMMAKEPGKRPTSVIAAIRALEDAAVAAGIILPSVTAQVGAVSGQRTPSGLLAVHGTPAHGLTPGPNKSWSDFAGAATLDAGDMAGQPSAAVAAPATMAPAPRRRVWTFVAAAVGPLVAAVVAFVAIKGGKTGERTPASASETIAGSDRPKDVRAAVEPRSPAPAAVEITLTGLPAGTEVIDPDGHVLTTAAGGDTRFTLARSAAALTLGLHHPDRGDGYVMVTPSDDVVKEAAALTAPGGTLVDATKKKPGGTRPPKREKKTAVDRDQGPSGTDSLESPFKD